MCVSGFRWGLPENMCPSSDESDSVSSPASSAASSRASSPTNQGTDASFKLDEIKNEDGCKTFREGQFKRWLASSLRARRCRSGAVDKPDAETPDADRKTKETCPEGSDMEVEEVQESNTTPDKADSSESESGGWVTDSDGDAVQSPPKRIKTSMTDDEENVNEVSRKVNVGSDVNVLSDNSEESDDESDEQKDNDNNSDKEAVDIGSFFDCRDPVYSKPTGPIRLSMNEIADYRQAEQGGSRFYSFGSADLQPRNFYRRKSCNSDSEENEFGFLSYFSLSVGDAASFAFPRGSPKNIEQVAQFWELDFQVGPRIYPKMSSWETSGRQPQPDVHPDGRSKYMAYKNLYHKWLDCNKSTTQWYSKYGGRSLIDIAHGRVKRTVHKLKACEFLRAPLS